MLEKGSMNCAGALALEDPSAEYVGAAVRGPTEAEATLLNSVEGCNSETDRPTRPLGAMPPDGDGGAVRLWPVVACDALAWR